MTIGLYLGGFSSIASLALTALLEGDQLPIIEGTGIGSIVLLLTAVRYLKQERDTAIRNLEIARERAHASEMKCLNCDYFRYNKLLSLVLQTDPSPTEEHDSLPSLETNSIHSED